MRYNKLDRAERFFIVLGWLIILGLAGFVMWERHEKQEAERRSHDNPPAEVPTLNIEIHEPPEP